MFVKSSHKFKAPALLPVTASVLGGQKMKVLENTDVTAVKAGTSLLKYVTSHPNTVNQTTPCMHETYALQAFSSKVLDTS